MMVLMTKRENAHPRQGKRKKDRWGKCRLCTTLPLKRDRERWLCGYFRCAKCQHWLCWDHLQLRKVRDQIGIYRLTCKPACVLRTPPVQDDVSPEWTAEEIAAWK